LIGTVDANQVMVSPQIQGRIEKLLVDEGSPVKAGDVIALLDANELRAQEQAATATINSLRSKVSETLATEAATKGSTAGDVANAEARLESTRAQLAQAEANLEQIKTDHDRTVSLAASGVASQQDKDRADAQLKAQYAAVKALQDQVRAGQADLNSAIARNHQATAAQRTVAATRADMANAAALRAQAQVRLSDTWVRAAVPETYADHIALGEVFNIRMPSGQVVPGKVFFKAVEGDFATQRDVSRRKRDIKTVVLKLRIENLNELFVPGMTADVLVPQAALQADYQQRKQEAAQPQSKPAVE